MPAARAELAALLPRLHTLEDLLALATALAWRPCPAELTLGADALLPTGARMVARRGALPWVGVHGRGARRLARRLLGAGRLAGVIALDAGARQLELSVAFGDVPLLALPLDAPPAWALTALARLAGSDADEGPLATAARTATALATADPGRRFFRAFRRLLDRFTAHVPAHARAEDRQLVALLPLTRLLFLYFVQSRGWLDGRPDFLARAVDDCLARRRGVQRTLLDPLFFGALNRPHADRRDALRRLGALPYLNGGLFEVHPLERRYPTRWPDTLWREAFDELFERFAFTATEGDGEAIAPDMLGQVFEGVMHPEARSRSGSFYTPAPLVRTLVDEALTALLSARLDVDPATARRALDAHDAPAAHALRHVTILDPAAGSGAFLLGALDRLAALQAAARAQPLAIARREVLQRNLFGVDVNPMAVRLAELRLWLALIADDATIDPLAVAPLPNLDAVVRQGDSLRDPLGATPIPPAAAERLGTARAALLGASGRAKARALRALREAELTAARAACDGAEARATHAIAECLEAARARSLFGERRGLTAALRASLARHRADRRELRQLRRRMERLGELPWFHYESHFADVFLHGGFDAVIGNPPWVRGEELPRTQRAMLGARYRLWRPARERGYAHLPDLSVAFVERGLELLKPGGVLALLVPEKLATTGYAAALRRSLAAGTMLHLAAPLGRDAARAFAATVYPLALVCRRTAPRGGESLRTGVGPDAPRLAQHDLAGGAPWILGTAARALPKHLLVTHPPLCAAVRPRLGVKTGADDVFLLRPHDAAPIEPALLRPALRGRDVGAFRARPARQLLWALDDDGLPLDTLPRGARRHLAPHLGRLLERADHRGGAPWTLFRTAAAAARWRVVWADITRRLEALVLAPDDRTVPLNTCYVAVMDSARSAHALAAWLNSRWLRALARLGAPPAAGGFMRASASVVGALPLPGGVLADDQLATLGCRATHSAPDQETLDDVAARWLGLDPRERAALDDLLRAAPRG